MLEVRGRKLQAMVAYLAASPGEPHARSRLMALLWGDSPEQQARQNLRGVLARARKLLGPGAISGKQETITLEPGIVSSDRCRAEALARRGGIDAMRRLAELYEGDYLDGLDIPEPDWEDWVQGERRRFRELALDTMMRLGDSNLADKRFDEALSLGMRACEIDGYREDAHRLVMRAFAGLGRSAEAARHYDSLSRRLGAELGTEPSDETRELAAALRDGEPASFTAARAGNRPTVAVLLFTNSSEDPAQDAFCRGVCEDIITELSRFRDLVVTDRASSLVLDSGTTTASDARIRLGAQYVVRGSVRRYDGRIRIAVQLTDAANDQEIWADRYDRELGELFSVQDDVVRTVSGTLVGWLERRGRERARDKPTSSLEAYELLIQGRAHFFRMLREENSRARDLFKRALELDADYAAAHTWLAETHLGDWAGGWTRDPRRSLDLGMEHAARAVWLDDTDSRSHTSLARAYVWQLECEKARHHFGRALALNPSDTWALTSSGRGYILEGQPARGLAQILGAGRISPLARLSYQLGIAHFAMRRYDDAVEALRAVGDPIDLVFAWLAASLARAGQREAARSTSNEFFRSFEAKNERVGAADVSPITFLTERFPFNNAFDRDHFLGALEAAGIH